MSDKNNMDFTQLASIMQMMNGGGNMDPAALLSMLGGGNNQMAEMLKMLPLLQGNNFFSNNKAARKDGFKSNVNTDNFLMDLYNTSKD